VTAASLCYDSFHPLEAQAQYNQRFVLIHFYISLAEQISSQLTLRRLKEAALRQAGQT